MHDITRLFLSNFISNENDKEVFDKNEIQHITNILLHREEKEILTRDIWGNWDFPYTDMDHSKPYLDEFVVNKINQNGIRKKNIWPNGKKMAVCFSHDVDVVSRYDIKYPIRQFKSKPKSPKNIFALGYQLIKQKNIFRKDDDELWCYEEWIKLLSKYNFTSTFYLYSHPGIAHNHSYDCDYFFTDFIKFNGKKMTVAEMMTSIKSAGFEIGLHSSYNTYNNPELMQKEALQVSEIINSNVISNRQHCLHFDIKTTPTVISSCGIKVDSSLGFNRSIGFRAGTSFPYFLAQKDEIKLDLLELPMHIMDSSLFRADCLALDENLAKKKCLNIINHVERVGGCLTINFHPNYITNKSWWSTFEFLVKELKERDAYCLKAENTIGLVE